MFIPLALSVVYVRLGSLPWIAAMFDGLKPVVLALIFLSVQSSSLILLRDFRLLILCLRSAAISWPGLLRIPFGQLCRDRGQITEQTSGAVVRSSGEVHLRGRCTCGIVIGRADVPGAECPDAIYS